MADWYFNTATGNDTTGDGSSGTPYATAQKCWNEASSGDSIYGCGTDTAGIDWGLTTKRLRIIGTDASWTVGGAQLVIDGGNSVASLITGSGSQVAKSCQFWYVTFKRCTGVCMAPGTNYALDACLFNRCIWENCGDNIFDDSTYRARYLKFYRCIIRNNSGHFLPRPVDPTIVFCRISDNTGFALAYRDSSPRGHVTIHSVIEGNGDVWYSSSIAVGGPRLFLGNVFDDNSNTMWFEGDEDGGGHAPLIIGNRITNMGTAITVPNASRKVNLAHNYFHGNTLDITAGRYQELDDNLFDQATDGYENHATGDFNLASDADYRSIVVPIDWDV